jgi:ubiquinone/menaquinone biosynthesis C-methylase UbiE
LAQNTIFGNDSHGLFSPFAQYVSANLAKDRMKFLKRFLKGGKLLEIGPGGGEVMLAAKKEGFDIDGVECSENLIRHLKLTTSSTIYHGMLESIDFGTTKFDAILSFHVLEHVANPVKHLQYASAIVKPDGYLILATPNSYSWDRRIFKKRWTGYTIAHINLFSRYSIELCFKRAGWRIIQIATNESALTLLWSIKTAFKPRKRSLKSNFKDSGFKKIPLHLGRAFLLGFSGLTMPFRYIQSKLHGGNELLVIAQKS